jgi:transcriptional regulator with XRE-family HTH domain
MTVQRIVRELRSFMEMNSYSQTRLSTESGIPQSTISRALNKPKRLTETHRELCKIAGIALEESAAGGSALDELMQTVMEVWDGSREHAQSIARLLKAGATLEAYGAARAAKPRKTHASR